MNELIRTLSQQERLNFLVTNRIPRRLATQFMGWFSSLKSPLLARFSIAVWRLFAEDLKLEEARKKRFESLQECFTRELIEGARPMDQRKHIVVSPCDAIVGACGRIDGTTVYQAKGFPYELGDLLPDAALREKYRDGFFVTLRLKSSMYHRFHAPLDCSVRSVTYISGDTWNVNPIALRRIEKLYCKNERVVMELHTSDESSVTLVPVAAILVASIRLHCLEEVLSMKYRGPELIQCNQAYRKGDEMGYFQHGSTIILFASRQHELFPGIKHGAPIRMGEALLSQGNSGDHPKPNQI